MTKSALLFAVFMTALIPGSRPAAAEQVPDALKAFLATANPATGKQAFKLCKACHNIKKGGKNKIGPILWDVIGRTKAASPGYKYSKSFKRLRGTWTYRELDIFIASPIAFVAGTKMSFRGLRDPRYRASVIAYMRSFSNNPVPLP
jgi:cytochrome c